MINALGRIGFLWPQNLSTGFKSDETEKIQDGRRSLPIYSRPKQIRMGAWGNITTSPGWEGFNIRLHKRDKEIRNDLRAIGTNINQIAKMANQGLPVALSEIEKNKLLDQIVLTDKHTLKILRLLNV